MSDEKQTTLEEDFQRLEEVIGSMEEDDISLEDSFKLYEEGVKLLSGCNSKIDTIEKKVAILSGDGELTDFEGEE